jgi:bacterioferritin-associated ferredoxin
MACRFVLEIESRYQYHDFMLVGHCLRVFDGAIRECVRVGARTTEDVAARCGAGTRCGGCRDSIEAIVTRECPRIEARPSHEASPDRAAA